MVRKHGGNTKFKERSVNTEHFQPVAQFTSSPTHGIYQCAAVNGKKKKKKKLNEPSVESEKLSGCVHLETWS